MDVVGRVRGRVKVDDERYGVDMYSARRDIGGDEHIEPACTEGGQGTLSLTLTPVPVNRCRGQTGVSKAIRKAIGPPLRSAEDDRRTTGCDGLGGHRDPLVRVDLPEMM